MTSELSLQPPGKEIELKLTLPGDQMAALRRHLVVGERAVGRATSQTLRSVYFDTPSLRLGAAGIALRVRQVGRRFVQTLKTRGRGTAGLFSRTELEAPVAGEAPELGAIADLGLRSVVERAAQEEGLHAVVETEFRRTSRRLEWNENVVLFELDEGEVRTERGSAPIAELELELLRGDPSALYDLALDLVGSASFRLAAEGKVERGFALLRGETPQAMRARPIRHREGATLGEVVGTVVESAIEQLTANEPIARDGFDPEGVHQMRVALRRLRAAFSMFRKVLPRESLGTLRAEARWLAGELGFVRDLDVFLGETLQPLGARFSANAGLKRLREDAQTLRDASQAQLREHLDSTRYTRFVLELGRWHAGRGWLHQPLSEQGARLFRDARQESRVLLTPLHRKARKLGRNLANSSLDEKHALRIHLKKVRYGAEFLMSLHDQKAGRRYAARVAALQDVLGHLNDVGAARKLLDLLLEWMGPEAPAEAVRATGLVEGWTARGAEDALRDLDRLWQRFVKTKPFWS